MKKLLYVLSLLIIASMVLTACGGAAPTQAPAATDEPATSEATSEATEAPEATAEPGATEAPTEVAATPTTTPYPVASCEGGKTCIRWFVGL